jgi:methylphosphotriester-DNA--protein-cysteine methyltransferase
MCPNEGCGHSKNMANEHDLRVHLLKECQHGGKPCPSCKLRVSNNGPPHDCVKALLLVIEEKDATIEELTKKIQKLKIDKISKKQEDK